MSFITKAIGKVVSTLTGQSEVAKQAERNADATIQATNNAAAETSEAIKQQALQASQQQAAQVARSAAEQRAAEIISAPVGTAEVLLTAPTTESSTATAKKRRAAFSGQTYDSGVNI